MDIRNKLSALISGNLLPYLSLKGPNNNCPTASQIILVVNPSWMNDELVLKNCDMAGNVGKYISVTKGTKAVSIPKKIRMNSFEFLLVPIVDFYFAAKLENLLQSFCFVCSTEFFIIGIKYF